MPKVVVTTNDRRVYSAYDWLRIGLIGLLLGVVTFVLGWLLETYIVDPLVCRGGTLEACGRSGAIASNVSVVVTAVIGAGLLIRQYVHRPIGVALAVAATFWGISALMDGLFWGEAIAWFAGLYAIAYLLFTSLFRIKSLFVAVIVTGIAVLVLRWVAFL